MKTKPNIIFLLCDQQQKQVLDEHHPCILPHTRKLMEQSVVFDNAHTCNAICSPSRASLLTGMLPHNHGMVDCTHTVPAYRAEYDSSLDTFTNALWDEGYTLGYFGKWHIERTHQLEHFGFTEYETERDIPAFPVTAVDKLVIKTNGYEDRVVCGTFAEGEESTEEYYIYSKGLDFISRHKGEDRPWCTFLSTYAPHDPYTVPKKIYDSYGDIDLPASFYDTLEGRPNVYKRLQAVWDGVTDVQCKQIIRSYYSYCTLIDLQIGRLTEYLQANGLMENTMIVYLADHGDLMGAHRLFCKGVPAFEEAYNIPLFFKLPKGQPAGSNATLVNTQDIAPTVLELAGCRKLRGKPDGASFADCVTALVRQDNRIGFAEFQGQRYAYTQRIVWQGDYKYVFNTFDYDELYNLKEDPHEMKNLASDPAHTDILHSLTRIMWKEMKRTGDETMCNAEYYMLRFAPVGPEKDGADVKYQTYNKVF